MATIDVKDAAGSTQTIQQPNANGQAAMASSRPVAIASDQSIIPVGSKSIVASATFTRPANTTAYSIGDIVANSTTAGSVTPMSFTVARVNAGTGRIWRARMSTSKTVVGTEMWRLYLFTSSPTVAAGDNGAFSANIVAAGHIGCFDIIAERVGSDGSKGVSGPSNGSFVQFVAGAGVQVIYGLLEIRTTYTPTSGETYVVELEVEQD